MFRRILKLVLLCAAVATQRLHAAEAAASPEEEQALKARKLSLLFPEGIHFMEGLTNPAAN